MTLNSAFFLPFSYCIVCPLDGTDRLPPTRNYPSHRFIPFHPFPKDTDLGQERPDPRATGGSSLKQNACCTRTRWSDRELAPLHSSLSAAASVTRRFSVRPNEFVSARNRAASSSSGQTISAFVALSGCSIRDERNERRLNLRVEHRRRRSGFSWR